MGRIDLNRCGADRLRFGAIDSGLCEAERLWGGSTGYPWYRFTASVHIISARSTDQHESSLNWANTTVDQLFGK